MIPASTSAPPERHCRRDHSLYRKFYQEAFRKLQANEYLARQRAWTHTDYCTTYEDKHGNPGFEPTVERELREGSVLAELHPLDESALSLWYCRQRAAATRGMALPMVTPEHSASQPFHRTATFTTPTHLTLHESPVEQQRALRPLRRARLELLDRLQLQGWLDSGGGHHSHRYPLTDVFPDPARKHWCDRLEDPIRRVEWQAGRSGRLEALEDTPRQRGSHVKPYG